MEAEYAKILDDVRVVVEMSDKLMAEVRAKAQAKKTDE